MHDLFMSRFSELDYRVSDFLLLIRPMGQSAADHCSLFLIFFKTAQNVFQFCVEYVD